MSDLRQPGIKDRENLGHGLRRLLSVCCNVLNYLCLTSVLGAWGFMPAPSTRMGNYPQLPRR